MFIDVYLKVEAINNLAHFLSLYPCKDMDIAPIKDYVEKWRLYLEIAKSLADTKKEIDEKELSNETLYSQCVDLPSLSGLIYNLKNKGVNKSYFKYKKEYLEQYVREHEINSVANLFEHVFGEKGSRSREDLAEANLDIIRKAFAQYGDDKIKDMVENYQNVYFHIKNNLDLKPFVERVIKQNPQEPCVKNYLQFFNSPDIVINSLFDYKYLEPLLDNIEKNYVDYKNDDNFNGIFINLE